MVTRSITKAANALNGVTNEDLKELSVADCACMLQTLPSAPEFATVRSQLAQRLQRQLSTSWIDQGDAYEVFLVLVALWQYQPALVTGEHLAAILQRLINAELAVGGPYYFKSANTVLINAQIAVFMRLVAKPLPNVDAFLAQAVDDGFFEARHASQIDLYLFAQATTNPKLALYLRSHWTRKSWQTPIGIATAVAVLARMAPPNQVQQALIVLCGQQHNGWWTFAASANNKLTTTAIVVGVLAGHQQTKTSTSWFCKRQQIIAKTACQALTSYSDPLRSLAVDSVTKVVRADKNFEITLLSLLFARALKSPDTLTDQQHTKLGLGSLFGWVAYTIYDDFLDNKGQPAKMPVANIAMRASVEYFRMALPAHTTFASYVAKAFSKMDEANAWEVKHCRFIVRNDEVVIGKLPKYGRRTVLALRSFAHTLAPTAVLWHYGQASSLRHIRTAFVHYLIARQLSDDLHDWPDDIQNGQASYVVAAILRDIRIKPGVHRLNNLLPTMQKSFRRKVLPKVCQCVLHHIAVSRQEFQKSKLLRTDNDFYVLLDRLEQAAKHSLDVRAKSLAFYKASKSMKFKK